MSAPTSDLPAQRRPDLRPWLPVLLPFAALGLLPWWVCLALCAALALSRLGDDSRSISALLVLLAAAAVSGPLLLGTAPDRLLHSGNLFAQAAAVGLLSLASLRALEGGQRRGLLPAAAALLLFPNAFGLATLIVVALGLNGADSRPRLRFSQGGGRSLAALLGAALLVGVLALLLGLLPYFAPSAPLQAAAPRATTAQAPPPPVPDRTNVAPAWFKQLTSPANAVRVQDPLLLRPLVPITGLLVVICMLMLFRQTKIRRGEQPSRWTDVVAVTALLATLVMVGVIGAGARGGGLLGGAGRSPPPPGAGGRTAAQEAARHSPNWLPTLLNIGLIFATLFFAAAAVYLYFTTRAAGAANKTLETLPETGAVAGEPLPPLHRVRLAWRGIEAALAAAGLARVPSETPESYAARLSSLVPAAAGDLHTLTRLYLPVRYGGVLSEADAAQAEASAESIRTILTAPADATSIYTSQEAP
jgi:Domain of unknown function (DUF4129)